MTDTNRYNTSDLALAAFLMMKGLNLINASRLTGGRFEFEFADPDGEAFNLSLEYVNSDFCQFDNHLRSLKKILYKS
jgi:hypothetical protein